jgi:putative membrane protein
MWHAHDAMGWWMLFGATFWLLFWVSIVWLIVSVIRPHREPVEHDDALAIARRRYASGEITREEFERIRDDLAGAD